MHARERRGRGRGQPPHHFSHILCVREIVHLVTERFARAKDVGLGERRVVRAGLREDVAA